MKGIVIVSFIASLFFLSQVSSAPPTTQPSTQPATAPTSQPSAKNFMSQNSSLYIKLMGEWRAQVPYPTYAQAPASIDLGDETLYRFYHVRQLRSARLLRNVT